MENNFSESFERGGLKVERKFVLRLLKRILSTAHNEYIPKLALETMYIRLGKIPFANPLHDCFMYDLCAQ